MFAIKDSMQNENCHIEELKNFQLVLDVENIFVIAKKIGFSRKNHFVCR